MSYVRNIWKEYHKRKKDTDKGMYDQYDDYTPLNMSQEKIYQECANIKFQKAWIHPPNPIRDFGHRMNQSTTVSTRGTDITHMITSNLKMRLKCWLRKADCLNMLRAVSETRKNLQNPSPLWRFLKSVPVVIIETLSKVNTCILMPLPMRETQENLSSKGTVKRKIVEIMVVYINEGSSSPKAFNWPMLGFFRLWEGQRHP